MIKRKWPKVVAALGFHSSNTPVAARPRASLSLPRESDKERPGSPPDPRAGRQPSSGGCRPGLPLDSRPNPGLHWPPGRIGAPCAAGPGRGASAQPATGRGRFWADPAPWIGWGSVAPRPPFRKGGGAEGPGGFLFQPEGLAARRLALKDCKMTPPGTPTAGRGKCRHTYFLPSCLAAFAGGT